MNWNCMTAYGGNGKPMGPKTVGQSVDVEWGQNQDGLERFDLLSPEHHELIRFDICYGNIFTNVFFLF